MYRRNNGELVKCKECKSTCITNFGGMLLCARCGKYYPDPYKGE